MSITCQLCETAKATEVKFDTDENDARVAWLICGECAETQYDGTEDYPETVPLAVAA